MKKNVSLNNQLFEIATRCSPTGNLREAIESTTVEDYDDYPDLVGYMMANDGEYPSGNYYYSDGPVVGVYSLQADTATIKAINKVISSSNSFEEFVNSLYKTPFYLLKKHFENAYPLYSVQEISKQQMKEHFGGKIDINSKETNRPRFFKAKYDTKHYKGMEVFFVQPNRKKNSYITIRNYYMTNSKGQLFYSGMIGQEVLVVDLNTIIILD